MCVQYVQGYQVDMPIFIDLEDVWDPDDGSGGRANNLSVSQRTSVARAFCDTVRSAGYKAGIYATAEDLEQLLGVQPGSASVLGLLNDTEHRVTLVLDRAVAESRWFGCHPCRNTSSLRLRTEDVLEKFLPHTGHVPLLVEL